MRKIFILLLVLSVKQTLAQFCFNPPTTITSVSVHYDVCTSDFNNDLKPDVALPNNGGNNILISLGTGTGSFAITNTITSSGIGKSIASADFNGDSKPDIAVAASTSKVRILLGNGVGGFSFYNDFTIGGEAFSIITGDFNGDLIMDLATANGTVANVSILLGVGNGSFSPITNYATFSACESITSADFNSDGKLDLASCSQGGSIISLLQGSGTGTFGAPLNLTAQYSTPSTIISADFNGDSKMDLATSSNAFGFIEVFLGTGTGTFGLPSGISTGVGNCPSLTSGDYNGDGKLDIAAASSSTNQIAVLRGSGVGTFSAPVTFTTNTMNTLKIKTADFNSDGKSDLVSCGFSFPFISTSFLINSLPIMNITATVGNLCISPTATLTATGATTYSWSPNAYSVMTPTAIVLPNLTETYTVTGTIGACTNTQTVSVTGNIGGQLLSIGTPVVFPSCPQLPDGSVGANPFGGTPPYTHLWNTGYTGNPLSGLSAGNYSVVVTDANGCTVNSANFPLPSIPGANFTYTVNGMTVQYMMVDAIGCTSGGFLWDYGNGMTSTIAQQPFVTYATSGIYSACLKCNNLPTGCVVCANITLPGTYTGTASAIGIREIFSDSKFYSLHPNPANNILNIKNTSTNAIDLVTVLDITGRKVLEQNENTSQINIEVLEQGMYQLLITSEGKNYSSKFIKE